VGFCFINTVRNALLLWLNKCSVISDKDLGILAQFFLYIVLKWLLVNTPSFVMLACV